MSKSWQNSWVISLSLPLWIGGDRFEHIWSITTHTTFMFCSATSTPRCNNHNHWICWYLVLFSILLTWIKSYAYHIYPNLGPWFKHLKKKRQIKTERDPEESGRSERKRLSVAKKVLWHQLTNPIPSFYPFNIWAFTDDRTCEIGTWKERRKQKTSNCLLTLRGITREKKRDGQTERERESESEKSVMLKVLLPNCSLSIWQHWS